jgi:phosphomannomutase
MKPIVFGTDGWRGVIADDFTFDRVAAVCAAVGQFLQEEGTVERGVAIGFDNRFASPDFAALAATMLTRRGIPVRLAQASLPTPVISYVIKRDGLGGGVMITASHNPAKYNGVKFKPWYAGSASPEATKAIEAHTNALLDAPETAAARAQGPDPALLTREDFIAGYVEHVLGFVKTDVIRTANLKLLFDPLFGSSIGVLDRALREAGCTVEAIHDSWNPGFAGLHPEPIPDNLGGLLYAVRNTTVSGAVASDGDGDRLSAVTEDGEYVSPHHVFALLLMHLVEDLGLRGGVVKTVSTSTMIDQLAQNFDLPLTVTPIGFKYICELMLKEDVLIGGEESGGIGVRGHIPERDATLAALLLVEMMAMRGTTLGGLMAGLRARVGAHAYDRIDVLLKRPVSREQFTALQASLPQAVAGETVREVSTRDGLKLFLADGHWLLLRASGTEPVLRIYAEAESIDHVHALLGEGRALTAAVGIEEAERH